MDKNTARSGWQNHWRTFKQILKEFSLPFAVAIAWTIYNWSLEPSRSITALINLFAPTFFFAAWAIGQWLRVTKQIRTEDSFAKLEARADELLNRIDLRVNEIIDVHTGGDSYCLLFPVRGLPHFVIFHHGGHVLYDVRVSIQDQKIFQEEAAARVAILSSINVVWPTVFPNIAAQTRDIPYPKLENREWVAWNIHFIARNGQFFQALRWAKVGGQWHIATYVSRGGKTLREIIDKDFPLVDGKVDWHRYE